MEKIIITPFVLHKLNDLVDTLFYKEYFGFKETAVDYVDTLVNFINTLPKNKRYPTKNNEYGDWFSKYKKSKSTTWYVVFDLKDGIFLVKNIINNYTKDYPEFIGEIK